MYETISIWVCGFVSVGRSILPGWDRQNELNRSGKTVFRERQAKWLPLIVENSIIRARCRRGANLNSIYRRISRLAAEIRSTRSRNEGSRLAVDRERWTDAASIIRRLHRNFARQMQRAAIPERKRERETLRIHSALRNTSRTWKHILCRSSWVNGKRAGTEPRVFGKLSPNWRAELTVAAACTRNAEDRMVAVLFARQFADCSTRSPLVRFLATGVKASRAMAGLFPLVVCPHA